MLQTKMREEMKQAMIAKDAIKLSVVRGVLSGFTNELVTLGRMPQDALSDEEALKVILRIAKQRKDSIEQFRAGGREDLVIKEEEELAHLSPYLPIMMERSAIKPIAEQIKNDLGITDKTKSGQLMATIMKELKGKADGNDVKAVVEELLA
jgi:uncharacterized protein YqeY